MSIPILKHGLNLIVSIQALVSDQDLLTLRDNLAVQVGDYRSKGVIIDVSELDVMDSFSTKTLHNLAITLQLRGVKMIIVGIQPEVAFAMVQLGLTLKNVTTALNLEDGLKLLEQQAQS